MSFNNQTVTTVDPHLAHLEELRQTSLDIRRRQNVASRATEAFLNGQNPEKLRHGFARQAHEYATHLQQSDARKVYANILATLPNYVDAVNALPDRHDRSFGRPWLSPAEWDAAKDHTIEYNYAIRAIIEHNPTLPQTTILSMISEAADKFDYPADVKEMIVHNTMGILRGMQHEIAFELALRQLPDGYEYLETNDDDDARGADVKVRCPNGVVVSIDIKATERLAEESRERTERYMKKHHKRAPENEIVMFSGFDTYDFSNESPWLPSKEAIARVLPTIIKALRTASERTQASRR